MAAAAPKSGEQRRRRNARLLTLNLMPHSRPHTTRTGDDEGRLKRGMMGSSRPTDQKSIRPAAIRILDVANVAFRRSVFLETQLFRQTLLALVHVPDGDIGGLCLLMAPCIHLCDTATPALRITEACWSLCFLILGRNMDLRVIPVIFHVITIITFI